MKSTKQVVLFAAFILSVLAATAQANDFDLTLNSGDGSTKFSIQNSNAVEIASITSKGAAYFHNVVSTTSLVSYRLTATSTTINVSPAMASTGLGFNVAPNENWSFEFNLQNGDSSANGCKWGLAIPAGANVFAMVEGSAASAATRTTDVIIVGNTPTAITFNTQNNQGHWTRIRGIVTNGATAGQVTLQFAAVTAGTVTLYVNSYVVARKLAN